jgi:hypothetical protein
VDETVRKVSDCLLGQELPQRCEITIRSEQVVSHRHGEFAAKRIVNSIESGNIDQ